MNSPNFKTKIEKTRIFFTFLGKNPKFWTKTRQPVNNGGSYYESPINQRPVGQPTYDHCNGVFSKWSGTFIEFSEFREFRESEESLKHELGSV